MLLTLIFVGLTDELRACAVKTVNNKTKRTVKMFINSLKYFKTSTKFVKRTFAYILIETVGSLYHPEAVSYFRGFLLVSLVMHTSHGKS